MPDILRIGLSGLLASQRALGVVSHNIANAGNPDFSRQRVDFTPIGGQLGGLGNGLSFGRGTEVTAVSRVYDQFLTRQLQEGTADHANAQTFDRMVGMATDLVGDSETGLLGGLTDFFSGIQDVADDPASRPERTVLLERGRTLSARFRDLDRGLSDLRTAANQGLNDSVNSVNGLARSIATVNREIVATGGSGLAADNDLLDRRDALLKQLAGEISIETVAQPDGQVNVFVGSGQGLVVNSSVRPLEVVTDPSDHQNVGIRFQDQPAGNLSSALTGGRIGAYLEFRDQVLPDVQNNVGVLAVNLATAFNAQHQLGMDLNGNLGKSFFAFGGPTVISNDANAGSATLTATFSDAQALTGSDYEISFDGSQYTMRRLSDDNITTFAGTGPVSVDGFEITVSGGTPVAGDRFIVQPTRNATKGLVTTLTDPAEIAAALPVRSGAAVGNTGSGVVAVQGVTDAADPALGNTVRIEFTAAGTFDVVDETSGSTLATAQPHTDGGSITFNGWEVSISGTPQSGDVFRVERNSDGVGDNRNALTLGQLERSTTVLGGRSPLGDVYPDLIASVGSRGANASIQLDSKEAALANMTARRESTSGVNLDEEAASLMQYQQTYEAAAEVVRVASSLFDTFLNAIRR